MISIQLALLVVAFLCFAFAAINDRSPNYARAMAAGLAFGAAALLVR